MPRIVSGFKKQKHSRRTVISYAVLVQRWMKRQLARPIITLSFRGKSKKTGVRAQAYLKRDVMRRRHDNPYGPKQTLLQRAFEAVTARRFAIAFTILLIVSGTWFSTVFIRPTFYLTKVVVKGTDEIDPQEIIKTALDHMDKRNWLFIRKSHRLFLDTETLAASISEHYDLERLNFNPHWPSKTLEIDLQEKPSTVVYAAKDHYYAVDKTGQVIRDLGQTLDASSLLIPVIYADGDATGPQVGHQVLTRAFIDNIRFFNQALSAYPDVRIHSFRITNSPQNEIRIQDQIPQTDTTREQQSNKAREQLKSAAESIANAQTVDEQVDQLRAALETLEVEKIEEGKVDKLLNEERVYKPTEGYKYNELEIYMQEGWSLKLGHTVFEDAQEAGKLLNIFATLTTQIDLNQVREYIDLRFGNRVYYR